MSNCCGVNGTDGLTRKERSEAANNAHTKVETFIAGTMTFRDVLGNILNVIVQKRSDTLLPADEVAEKMNAIIEQDEKLGGKEIAEAVVYLDMQLELQRAARAKKEAKG